MKNKTLEDRILYWQAKKPGSKLFDTTSPLFAIINEADNTKGVSWLGVEVLNDFVDGLAYGLIGSLKGENSEESKKSIQLTKPVLDFLRDFRDRIVDSEITTNEKFIVNGAEILITKDEIIKQARRSDNRILRTRADVTETLKDFIAYKRDLYSPKTEITTNQTQQIQEPSNDQKQTLISKKIYETSDENIEYKTEIVFGKDLDNELQIFYKGSNGAVFTKTDLINYQKCFGTIVPPGIKLNFIIGAVQDFGYFTKKLEEKICKKNIDSYNNWISERFQFKGKDLTKELVATYKTGKQERTVSRMKTINKALDIIDTQEIPPIISFKTSL